MKPGRTGNAQGEKYTSIERINPSTKIEFKIPLMEQVNVSVYNLEGRLVKTLVNQVMSAGNHVVNWDGTNEIGAKVSTGMYIYQLKTNSTNLNRRMTFIK